MNIQEKAKEKITYLDLNFDKYDIEQISKLMVEFAREMCEIQKQECLKSAKVERKQHKWSKTKNPPIIVLDNKFTVYDYSFSSEYTINENLILNCKNVCDE